MIRRGTFLLRWSFQFLARSQGSLLASRHHSQPPILSTLTLFQELIFLLHLIWRLSRTGWKHSQRERTHHCIQHSLTNSLRLLHFRHHHQFDSVIVTHLLLLSSGRICSTPPYCDRPRYLPFASQTFTRRPSCRQSLHLGKRILLKLSASRASHRSTRASVA